MATIRVLMFMILSSCLSMSSVLADEVPLPKVDYSADVLMTVSMGQGRSPMQMPGKVYYSQGNERRETQVMGQQSISIFRSREDRFIVLMPAQRMYMESRAEERESNDPSVSMLSDDMHWQKVGAEKIDGIATTKYRFSEELEHGGSSEGYVWLTKEQIPLQVEGTSRQDGELSKFSSKLSNLQIGRQPASLFEIPDGYQPMRVPNMFGGMSGGDTRLPDGPSSDGSGMGFSEDDMQKMKEQLEQFRQQMGQ